MTKREIDQAAKAAYERSRKLAKQLDQVDLDRWDDLLESQRAYWRDVVRSAFEEMCL